MTIFARVRTLTQRRNWLGTKRDEQVKGRRPRTSIHTHVYTHRASGQREGRRGVGKEDTAEGFITRDLLLLPGGRGPLHNGQRRGIRRGVCLSDTCSSRTRTRVSVRVYTATHGCTDAGHIVGMSRHPCIPSPSDLRLVVLPLHACITSRVIER